MTQDTVPWHVLNRSIEDHRNATSSQRRTGYTQGTTQKRVRAKPMVPRNRTAIATAFLFYGLLSGVAPDAPDAAAPRAASPASAAGLEALSTLDSAIEEDPIPFVPLLWQGSVQEYGDDGGVCQLGSPKYDAMACFLLSQVRIVLPSQSFQKGIFHLEIDELVCANVTVSRLHAQASGGVDGDATAFAAFLATFRMSSPQLPTLSLNVNVAEMGTICTATYRTMGLEGSLTAIVGQPVSSGLTNEADHFTGAAALDWTLHINSTTTTIANSTTTNSTPSEWRMPSAVSTTSCETQMQVTDLSFQGSISSHLINLFHGQIAAYVTSQINANLCPVLVAQVDPYVTEEIQLLEEWLQPYLMPPHPMTDNTSTASDLDGHKSVIRDSTSSNRSTTDTSSDWIDFTNDAPAISNALDFVNKFVFGDHLSGGFLRHVFPNVREGAYRHCGAGFDGWNGILAALMQPNEILQLPIPDDWQVIEFDVNDDTHIRISLGDSLQLRGVDHWSIFQLLLPARLREFGFELSSVDPVSLDMHVTVNVSSMASPLCNNTQVDDPECLLLMERMRLSVNASHIDLQAAVELGARRDAFRTIPIGAVIQLVAGIVDPTVDNARSVQCIFRGVDRIAATDLAASLTWDAVRLSRPPTSISSLSIAVEETDTTEDVDDDDLENDLDQVINEVINRVVLHEYSQYVSAAILGLSHGPLPQVLNQVLQRWLDTIPAADAGPADACRSDEDLRFPNWVNFTQVDLLQQLNGWLDQSSTVEQLNDYVDCIVDFLILALKQQFQSISLNLDTSSDTNGSTLELNLRTLSILNAGSLRHVRAMQPQRDGMYLSTGLSYGSNTTFDKLPQLELELDMSYQPLNFTAQFNFTFAVNDVDLGLGTILNYNLNALKSMLVQHVARHGECWVAPVGDWDWIDPEGRLGFVAVSFNATARALTMDQPMFLVINSERDPSIREFCINLVFWTVDTVRDILRSFTGALQAQASRNCGEGDGDEGGEEAFPSHFTSLLVIMAAVLLLAQPAVMLIQHKPQVPADFSISDEDYNDENELTRPLLPEARMQDPHFSLYDEDVDENDFQETQFDGPGGESPLMDKNRLDVAVGVAVALTTTAVLTLSSHMSSVASVDISVILGGRSMSFPSLIDLNPIRAVTQMNHVGFNPLLLFAGTCSGAWPYARLFLLLQAWASTYRNPKRRGELAELVDGFGKYAYVEVYVVFFAIVLFHCHASVDENHVLDVIVSPKFGLTGFWVSSMAAAALGHAILHVHRRDDLRHRQRSISSAANRSGSSVLTHGFTVESPSHRSKRQLSRFFYGLLLLWALATLSFLCLGLSRELFTVHFKGSLGDVLLRDFGADQKSFSLLSLGSQFPASASSPTGIVTIGMTAFYFVTVLVMPMACLVILGGLLLVPLPLDRQISLLSWAEAARSWSAVEVASVSVLLAAWQLPKIVNAAVQKRCDDWLRFVVTSDETKPLLCLRMETVFDRSAWYLVVGVVLHTTLVALCLRLSRQSIEERLLRGGHEDQPPRHHHHHGPAHNVVQLLADFSWLSRLVLAPPNDHYRLLDPSSSESGPPLQGQGGVSGTEPWQVTASFEEEWNEAAERDPEWKEWKDATQVT